MDFTVKEAVKTSTFWLLNLCITLRILVTVTMHAHMIPVFVWKGMSESTGAYLVSLSAFLAIISMLGLGWSGDRFNKPLLCSFSAIFTIICFLCPVLSSSKAAVYLLPIGVAVAHGTAPLNWSLIGDFFGRRSYAALRGVMVMPIGIATFIAPVYAGWIYDLTESYTAVLISFSVMLLMSAILFGILKRPKPVSR